MGQFGGGIDGELGDGAVGVLEGQVDIDVVAVGQDIGRLDGRPRRRMVDDLQHQVDGGAGGQRRLRDGQQGVADRAVLVGRLDVQLDRHFAPVDDGDQIFAGARSPCLKTWPKVISPAACAFPVTFSNWRATSSPALAASARSGALRTGAGSLDLDHGRDDGGGRAVEDQVAGPVHGLGAGDGRHPRPDICRGLGLDPGAVDFDVIDEQVAVAAGRLIVGVAQFDLAVRRGAGRCVERDGLPLAGGMGCRDRDGAADLLRRRHKDRTAAGCRRRCRPTP